MPGSARHPSVSVTASSIKLLSNETVYVHPGSVSLLGWFVKFYLWVSGDKPKLTRKLRSPPGKPRDAIPARFFGEFKIAMTQVNGRNVHTLVPKGTTSGQVVFYIHGAYILNIAGAHWNLIGDLIRQTNATFVVPDYPKAPGATVPVGLAMVEQAYKDLTATVPAENITIMAIARAVDFPWCWRKNSMPTGPDSLGSSCCYRRFWMVA
ncbi:alpha/beta hydrolase fold domain-containing protein [Rhizobium rhizogenes]|uniref:alpha/beta hydrolase n=1 Tax=Rhizobium rhizogenes TaxID=359 RepID=UPI0005654EFF|nr:alpha/beta hydrolase [Rhizobium rhizogenes]NTF84305.1 alpha/beta hydrolase fold domain-containing protein [Rhizobium rhizogenes]NTH80288.1 alpha/beta hydrolase fold domain-containing protein [Rhizobium rhizogenes]NTH86265.1 alpha/beta hydrolase fold domain-containing protein [Rhizobium rhizogenes]NTI25464.1 alpha/beta hydrolase fold domain-containing protein [Rhizobium rhizogenes]NTI77100.1 alpha/beta hydrolase fold domain-containing protein [Rhizobium rhizogenes]